MLAVIPKRRDFLAAARAASAATPGFVLQARRRSGDDPWPAEHIRYGLTASKKVGGAVTRNRARRRLRALAFEVLPLSGRAGWDYVLVARADATVSRRYALMRDDLVGALAAAHEGRAKPRPHGGSRRKSKKTRSPAPQS